MERDLHHVARQRWCYAIGRKQRRLRRTQIRLHDLDRLAPRGLLAIVDLAQVQELTLHHAPILMTAAFDNAPVTVCFTVLESLLRSQVHGHIACATHSSNQGARSALQPKLDTPLQ